MAPRTATRTALLALLALLVPLCACTWVKRAQKVLITSEPPGARVVIDGHDTGRTTPHAFDMAGFGGSNHVLELHRDGYRPARRVLYQYSEGYTTRWIDGASAVEFPALPIFWTAGDLIFPFGIRNAIVPGELYVKLYREDEPLLGFELLESGQGEAPFGTGQ